MDRMLIAAADLAREYDAYWVGAEHLARMVLRRAAINSAPRQLGVASAPHIPRGPFICRIPAARSPRRWPLARSPCAPVALPITHPP